MAVEIYSGSYSRKVWDRTSIELATPVSAVRHVSAVRQATNCLIGPAQKEESISIQMVKKMSIGQNKLIYLSVKL